MVIVTVFVELAPFPEIVVWAPAFDTRSKQAKVKENKNAAFFIMIVTIRNVFKYASGSS